MDVSTEDRILLTGAAGTVGGVGRTIVNLLRQRDLPVRALVHREDERAEALRATGAEVVVGNLTRAADVARALAGCALCHQGIYEIMLHGCSEPKCPERRRLRPTTHVTQR